ncbi:membrane-associated phospholipid phosphatase [Anaerosolibacter carboniphilus]|uniref:Membrane-associated phospholipid phosphatase n=1 Tax=Anaerosolibacter carboniphilus TaxID=1417629 RepID=A0A841KQY1_9FIRM|nr:phosphatase PAP2 family protein [Anaerosolibacter carboniphilus]MBB6215906.1 membrane-associated phospholipid phosphatase [Anaerosolibacter carboniphilus]
MRLNKFQDYRHFFILTYYGFIWFLYYYTERTIKPEYYIHSKIDLYIPFVKYMIIPYIFWYVYIFGTLLYLGLKSKDDFLKLTIFLFTGMTLCFIFYMIFPNGQNLRPIIIENDIFSKLIRYIYAVDTPTNSSPSIHVLNAIAIHIALIRCKRLEENKMIRVSSFIVMALIIGSTVMIKQHSVLDVVYGIALSILLYSVIYNLKFFRLLRFGKLSLTYHSKKFLNFFSK